MALFSLEHMLSHYEIVEGNFEGGKDKADFKVACQDSKNHAVLFSIDNDG